MSIFIDSARIVLQILKHIRVIHLVHIVLNVKIFIKASLKTEFQEAGFFLAELVRGQIDTDSLTLY